MPEIPIPITHHSLVEFTSRLIFPALLVDSTFNIIAFSKGFTQEIFGSAKLGDPLNSLFDKEHTLLLDELLADTDTDDTSILRLLRTPGSEESGIECEVQQHSWITDDETTLHLLFIEVLEQKNKKHWFKFYSTHDPITLLPTRILLFKFLRRALHLVDMKHHRIFLWHIHLAEHKEFIEHRGYQAGVDVSRDIVARIRNIVGNKAVVTRIDVSDFAVIIDEPADTDLTTNVEKLRIELTSPYNVSGDEMYFNTFIGVSEHESEFDTAEVMVEKAKRAMNSSREKGGWHSVKHPEGKLTQHIDQWEKRHQLRKAWLNNDIEPGFLMLICSDTRQPAGVEVAVRYNAENQPTYLIDKLSALLNNNALGHQIGIWLLRRSLSVMGMPRKGSFESTFRLVFPLSMSLICSDLFLQQMHKLVLASPLHPSNIDLQLDQDTLEQQVDRTGLISTLSQLKKQGYHIVISGLGEGNFSYQLLKTSLIDRIRLDSSVIEDLPDGREAKAFTASISAMCHYLDIETSANGVYTHAQLNSLRKHHYSLVQGPFFGLPLSITQLGEIMNGRSKITHSQVGASDA